MLKYKSNSQKYFLHLIIQSKGYIGGSSVRDRSEKPTVSEERTQRGLVAEARPEGVRPNEFKEEFYQNGELVSTNYVNTIKR